MIVKITVKNNKFQYTLQKFCEEMVNGNPVMNKEPYSYPVRDIWLDSWHHNQLVLSKVFKKSYENSTDGEKSVLCRVIKTNFENFVNKLAEEKDVKENLKKNFNCRVVKSIIESDSNGTIYYLCPTSHFEKVLNF